MNYYKTQQYMFLLQIKLSHNLIKNNFLSIPVFINEGFIGNINPLRFIKLKFMVTLIEASISRNERKSTTRTSLGLEIHYDF